MYKISENWNILPPDAYFDLGRHWNILTQKNIHEDLL